ncbi:hypothetical protein DFH29DRAFT_425896 [Suillus ampliporus]|nr:hypothetical protein DFH29DRAFT_425896 [Suillus ampliporus]
MARPTTHDFRETSPQLQGPLFVGQPSQTDIDTLCHPRIPARYLHAGLKMDKLIYWKILRKIRDLALRHIDFSIPYRNQPQERIDYFKREVLLDTDLSHLTWYEDGWAVEVFLRILYHRPRTMRDLQGLNLWGTQPDRPRQMPSIVCSDNRATEPEDTRANTADKDAPIISCSRLAILSAYLASIPNFHRYDAVLTQAGLSTDEHLNFFFHMSPTWREKFIAQALTENSTLFERMVVLEILEGLKNATL